MHQGPTDSTSRSSYQQALPLTSNPTLCQQQSLLRADFAIATFFLDDTFEMPLQNCSMRDWTPFSAPPVHQLPSGPHHSHKPVCSALWVPPKYFGWVCPLLVCRNSVFYRVLAVLLDFYSDVKHACLFSWTADLFQDEVRFALCNDKKEIPHPQSTYGTVLYQDNALISAHFYTPVQF